MAGILLNSGSVPFRFVDRSWQAVPPLAFTVTSWLHALVDRLFPAAPKTAGNRHVLIVRRGLSAEYYAFCEILAKTNAAEVLLDRRFQERRRWQPLYVVQNRRRADRRGPVPSTWTEGNFILVQMSLADDDRPPG